MKSDRQIERERKAWARAKVLVAWLKLSRAVEDPDLTATQLAHHEDALEEAKAIASEWSVDWRAIVAEVERTG